MEGFVIVQVEIPVRMKLRENHPFYYTVPNFGEVKISLNDVTKPNPEEEAHATNSDDRRGTFVKSKATVAFSGMLDFLLSKAQDFYSTAAQEAVNKLIEAYRYITKDHAVSQIALSEQISVHMEDKQGNPLPNSPGHFQFSIGKCLELACHKFGVDEHSKIQDCLSGVKEINLPRSLLVDSMNHADNHDFQHALFDIGTSLEIHICNVIEKHKHRIVDASEKNEIENWLEKQSVYVLYDKGLKYITSHSLNDDEPNLFMMLEYIRALRNNIVHHRKAIFTFEGFDKYQPKHEKELRKREGQEISSPTQLDEIKQSAERIMDFVDLKVAESVL